MNLGELIQRLGDVTDDSNHNKYVYELKIRLINESVSVLWPKIFQVEKKFYAKPANLSIVADTYLYDLPSDSTRMLAFIKDENNVPLKVGDYKDFDVSLSGVPTKYDIVGSQIMFNYTPIVAATFPYSYYRVPTALVNPTDVVLFPAGFEMLIVFKAVLLGKLKTDDDMSNPRRAFDDLFNSFKSIYEPHPDFPKGITSMKDVDGEFMQARDPSEGSLL